MRVVTADPPVRRLVASWRSDAIPSPGRGAVQGVYEHAFNVAFGGDLVAVVAAGGRVPNGVGVWAPSPLAELGLRAGMPATLDARELSVPAARLVVALDAAVAWCPRPVLPAPGDPAAVAANLADMALQAWRDGPRGGLHELLPAWRGLLGDGAPAASHLGRRAGPAIVALLRALRHGEEPAAVQAGRVLLGLGPGLTPSGDDLLVGLLGTLVAVLRPGPRDALTRVGRRLGADAPDRTTLVGASYLRHAVRGEVTERMSALLGAVLAGDTADVRRETARTLAVGETSGLDGLLGVVLAVGILLDLEWRPSLRKESSWTPC